ncbi:retrotransposon protein [Cucumis melo var. makuwa]|uniref:Retrotransposon protein n=1 Tax=Cucumis melo var. makuwa TaxID=1194695 RepID=A0A5D3DTF3_CUCMM|nr:retrotransposon protein [Cucumis melo var. makuwa]
MSTSTRAPRHVWTKEEESTLMKCLMELVSMGGWKSDNGTFQPGYLAQLIHMMAEKLPGCRVRATTSHRTAKGLLSKPFPYYDELTYVFGRDRATGQFAETFADMGFNEPDEYERFDIADGNEELPPRVGPDRVDLRGRGEVSERWMLKAYLTLDQTNEQLRMIAEWPARALANDNHVHTKFFRILREMPELMSFG